MSESAPTGEMSVDAGAPPWPRGTFTYLGHQFIEAKDDLHGMAAFFLIALGVAVTKFNTARKVVHPLVRTQIARGLAADGDRFDLLHDVRRVDGAEMIFSLPHAPIQSM